MTRRQMFRRRWAATPAKGCCPCPHLGVWAFPNLVMAADNRGRTWAFNQAGMHVRVRGERWKDIAFDLDRWATLTGPDRQATRLNIWLLNRLWLPCPS